LSKKREVSGVLVYQPRGQRGTSPEVEGESKIKTSKEEVDTGGMDELSVNGKFRNRTL